MDENEPKNQTNFDKIPEITYSDMPPSNESNNTNQNSQNNNIFNSEEPLENQLIYNNNPENNNDNPNINKNLTTIEESSKEDVSIKINNKENNNYLADNTNENIDSNNDEIRESIIPPSGDANGDLLSFYGQNQDIENVIKNFELEIGQEFSMIEEDYLEVVPIGEVDDETFKKITFSVGGDLKFAKEVVEKMDLEGKIISKISDIDYLLMKSNSIKENNKKDIQNGLEKNNIFVWREILPDNDSFFRCIMFSFLEELILSRNNRMFRIFIYEFNENIENSYFKKILSFYKIDSYRVKLYLILIYCILFSEENSSIEIAHSFFIKVYNSEINFDPLLILNLKFLIYKYLKVNENKLYTQEYNMKIGNLLPNSYKKGEKFEFLKFYQNNLLQLKTIVAKISILIIPFVLRRDIFIYNFSGNDVNHAWVHTDDKDNKNFLPIRLIFFNDSYSIIYSKNYFLQFKNIFDKFSYISNNISNNENNKNIVFGNILDNIDDIDEKQIKISNIPINELSQIMKKKNSNEINNNENQKDINNNVDNKNINNQQNMKLNGDVNNNICYQNNENNNNNFTINNNNLNNNNLNNHMNLNNNKTNIPTNCLDNNINKNLNYKNNNNNNINFKNIKLESMNNSRKNNNLKLNNFMNDNNNNYNLNNKKYINNNNATPGFNFNLNNNINNNININNTFNQNNNNFNNKNITINNNQNKIINNFIENNNKDFHMRINSNEILNNINKNNNNLNLNKFNTDIGNENNYIDKKKSNELNYNNQNNLKNVPKSSTFSKNNYCFPMFNPSQKCPGCHNQGKNGFYCENCTLDSLIKTTRNNYISFIKNNIGNLIKEKPIVNTTMFLSSLIITFPNQMQKTFSETYYLLADMNKNIYNSKLNVIKTSLCLGCFKYIKDEVQFSQSDKGMTMKNTFLFKLPCGCIFCSINCLNLFLDHIPIKKMNSFTCGCGEQYNCVKLKYLLYFAISHNLIGFKNEILRIMYENMKNKCCMCNAEVPMVEGKKNNFNIFEIGDDEIDQIFKINKFNHLVCNKCVKNRDITKKNVFFCKMCSSQHSILNKKSISGQIRANCSIF